MAVAAGRLTVGHVTGHQMRGTPKGGAVFFATLNI